MWHLEESIVAFPLHTFLRHNDKEQGVMMARSPVMLPLKVEGCVRISLHKTRVGKWLIVDATGKRVRLATTRRRARAYVQRADARYQPMPVAG